MRPSSARGYVEPLAAIVSVLAVAVGVTVYAVAVADVLRPDDRAVADTVLDELLRDGRVAGVLDPARLAGADPPAGWTANVTLSSPAGRWTRGPVPPEAAEAASRVIAVRLGPGSIRPGRLTVVAWR